MLKEMAEVFYVQRLTHIHFLAIAHPSVRFINLTRAVVDRTRVFVDRDRVFVDRDRAFVDRSRAVVHRSRAFVDRDRAVVRPLTNVR
jgi:hypothetical protein